MRGVYVVWAVHVAPTGGRTRPFTLLLEVMTRHLSSGAVHVGGGWAICR